MNDDDVKKSMLKWVIPSIKNSTVKNSSKESPYEFNFRIEKAREQLNLSEKNILDEKYLIKCVNEFLGSLNMREILTPQVNLKGPKEGIRRISYSDIRKKWGNKKDEIVWIKLSVKKNNERIVSVIGTSEDIFFTGNAKSKTSSGKINQELGLDWFEKYVYIFPLLGMPTELNRSDVESGIGNYLISKGIPILDFYSHNY